jgi:hypothetical protein
MISMEHYWMGRASEYASDLTPEVTENAHVLIERVNRVLSLAAADDVFPEIDAVSGTVVASGWRPRPVNDAIPNSVRTSKHVIGCAIDLRDGLPERSLARWCLRNLDLLGEIGLWLEDPQWTPNWVHLQSVPPGSGERVFVPYPCPPLAAKLPEQRRS